MNTQRYSGDMQGIDLSNVVANLPSALQQGLTQTEGALATAFVNTPQVQSAIAQNAQQTLAQKIAQSFLEYKWYWIGGGLVAGLLVYGIGKSKRKIVYAREGA